MPSIHFFWFAFLLFLFAPPPAVAVVPIPPPEVAARAWILVDARTGVELAAHAGDERLPPASLTKLMTSYLLAREVAGGRISNDDMVLISDNAWAQNPVFAGSSLMWIETGKEVRLEDLHRGIVVSSGNDASVAVAEYIAGSEDRFTELMNRQAGALGMNNTFFTNSHGLHASGHYTSARDMALLARLLIRDFPGEYALYKESEYTYNNIRQFNRNTLVVEDPTIDGLKTGYTAAAGYCLVASAERQGMRLVSVVMGADSDRVRKAETRKLFNYGFRNFETRDIHVAGEELVSARLWLGEQEQLGLGLAGDISVTIPRGGAEPRVAMELDPVIRAPVAAGDAHGVLRVLLGEEVLAEAPLVALEAAGQAGLAGRVADSVRLFFYELFGG